MEDCPAIDVASGAEREAGPELNEALAWRHMTLVDEFGQIDPTALYQANVQRAQSLQTFSALAAGSTITTSNWVSHGPQNGGGRTRTILVNPSNPNQVFAGSASGGIWISNNAGQSWSKTPGYMTNLATETLAFDSSSTSIIYAGTGEFSYPDGLSGAGVFKSLDGGQSWNQLPQTRDWRTVQTLAARPHNGGFVLAGTDTGIWKTENGGDNWQKIYPTVLSQNITILSVAFDSTGTYAAATTEDAQGRRFAAYSTDGGRTFSDSTLPTLNVFGGDAQVAFGPTPPPPLLPTVYMIRNPEMLKSTDGGVTFQTVPNFPVIGFQQTSLWVSPSDPNFLVVGGLDLWRSRDGATSFDHISTWGGTLDGAAPHVDQHAIVADPRYGATNHTVYFGNDGGIYSTNDITAATVTWNNLNHGYQTTQFYAGAGSALGAAPLIGGTQDQGTIMVTAATSPTGRIVSGGDGGYVAIDPAAPTTMYFEYQSLIDLFRSLDGGSGFQDIVGPTMRQDSFLFVTPFIIDPNSSATLLVAGLNLWRARDASTGTPPNWVAIRQPTPCLPLVFSACKASITAMAVAPGNPNVIWAGLIDGRLDKTVNGSTDTPSWDFKDNNGNRNPLPNRFITRITIDPADANVVYVTFGGYNFNNIYKTTDGGTNWTAITSGIPAVPIRGVVRHPRNARQLYAATDAGVYESNDGGLNWVTSNQGPDDVAVDEVSFVAGSEKLLAATHGRGLWTADTSGVPCLYRLSATSGSFPSPIASTGSFNVIADPRCSWSASVDSTSTSWLRITSGNSGTGNGIVSFSVDVNTTGLTRSGVITAGGQRFAVIQSVGCSVNTITPTGGFYSGQGGAAAFDVAADAQCQWTALVDTASSDWITINNPATGQVVSGNGTVTFTIKANTASGNPADPTTASVPRFGKIIVNQKVFTVNQAGIRPPDCPLDSHNQPTFSINGPSTIKPDQILSLVAYPGAGFHYRWSV